jgi:Fe-S-cluster containining protein
MPNRLDNYHRMIERVDALCRGIEEALAGQITCKVGCSSCCTQITIFPVEAAALNAALAALPADQASAIRRHVDDHAEGERCPLLQQDRCLIYQARPIICRTHGLPIVYSEGGERNIDCCPKNKVAGELLKGSNLIDLERLNTLLVAVNALYCSQTAADNSPERLTIAEALRKIQKPAEAGF